jgi:hypothetical protein
MSDSVRYQIISLVMARMKTIKKTASYKTDLGNNIFHMRPTPLQDTEAPGMNILDHDNEKAPSAAAGRYRNTISIDLEISLAAGTATITDCYDVIEDVLKAIGMDDQWSGLADDTQPKGDKIEIDQDGKITGKVTVSIEIEYETAKWSF